MTLSGSTLPQVSSGGSVSGTFHVVTSDGCGPLEAVIDETATAKFSTASKATVTTAMPGTAGNCPDSLSNDSGNSNKLKRSLRRALVKMGLLSKRADNVNKDYVSDLSPRPSNPGSQTAWPGLFWKPFASNPRILRLSRLRSPLARSALAPSTA